MGTVESQNFVYRAVDGGGLVRTGEVKSLSRAAALEALAGQGLIPVDLREARARAQDRGASPFESWWTSRRRRVNQRELLVLTQGLGALLNAGLTIDRALQINASLAGSDQARAISEKLLSSVRSGQTLHQAFSSSGEDLPGYYGALIEAGEASGSLPDTLTRMAAFMQKQLLARERVRSALIYPSLLVGVVFFTLVVLLAFVLPRFELLFSESDAPLPLSTRGVLVVGRFVADYWWGIGVFTALVVASGAAWLRTPRGHMQLHRWLLRSRLVLDLPLSFDAARFLMTLSTLFRNGTPLAVALRIARGTVQNIAFTDVLGRVALAVQGGEPLSTALARTAIFPAVAVQLARVGEETGELEQMLASAATFLEEEAHRRLEGLLVLIVPALTIVMGLVVAVLIGSVLIGLLSINDLAF